MKLNCKVGDLAVIVSSETGLNGRIVTCLEFIGMQFWNVGEFGKCEVPTWRTDGNFPYRNIFDAGWCTDDQLRPIRNDPGADETLSWCDVPSEVTA